MRVHLTPFECLLCVCLNLFFGVLNCGYLKQVLYIQILNMDKNLNQQY